MWRPFIAFLLLCPATAMPESINGSLLPAGQDPLQISAVEAGVVIRGTMARTSITFSLSVEGDQQREAVMEFTLPEGTLVTGAALNLKDLMRSASVAIPSVAANAYSAIVARRKDPCLVQMLPNGRVRVKVFPVTAAEPRRVRLDFIQTLTPGLPWRLPLTAGPAGQMSLTVDAPGNAQHGAWVLTDAKMVEGFAVEVPAPWPAETLAGPDGNGGFVFHCLVPDKSTAPPPPRRVLIAMDASAEQRGRDAAAERRFLETTLAGAETVTLATFSAGLHRVDSFPVKEGKCPALYEHLDRIRCDGAPLPGLLDLSGYGADVVILSSPLRAPMGGAIAPRLPEGAPVIVLDSVSRFLSPAASLFAARSGGAALDPRTVDAAEAAKVLARRAPLSAAPGSLTELHIHRAAGWLEITGRLTAESASLTIGSGTPFSLRRGTDALRGGMIFCLLNAAAAQSRFYSGASPSEVLDIWRKAPALSENSSFIVMEEKGDYQIAGIDFPPDLGPSPPPPPAPVEAPRVDLPAAARREEGYVRGDLPQAWLRHLGYEKITRWMAANQWTKHGSKNEIPLDDTKPLPDETIHKALSQGADAALGIIHEAKIQEARRIVRLVEAEATPPSDPFGGPIPPPLSPEPWGGSPGSGMPLLRPALPQEKTGAPPPPAERPDPDAILSAWQTLVTTRGYHPEDILSTARALRAAGHKAESCRVLSDLIYALLPAVAVRLTVWQLQEWNETALAAGILAGALQQWPRDRGLILESSAIPRMSAPPGGADLRVLMECALDAVNLDLEVIGPDFEKASWQNPLPHFGGALSPDSTGLEPEEFLLLKAPPAEYTIKIHAPNLPANNLPCPVRLTLFTNWGRPHESRRTFLLPACPADRTTVTKITLPRQ